MNNLKVFSSKVVIFSIFTIIFFGSCVQQTTRKRINLNEDWVFYYAENNKWYEAEVPGNIHTDLLENKLIEDPFYNTNSDSIAWVADETWRYKKNFTIPNDIFERNLEIVFEGIDTYSEIILNGNKIGETDNMYKKWVFPISDSLKRKENTLEVIIFPSKKVNEKRFTEAGIAIPDSRVFSRKAPYQYGWDWGPDFETAGIFKNVYINTWVKLRMTNVNIETKSITAKEAIMVANIELESENYYNGGVKIISPHHLFDTLDQKLEILEGKNIYRIEFPVKNPKLWWCNGLGEPNLYDFKVQVSTKFRVEERNIKTGIRNVVLHNNNDSIGQEFYFTLNGVPVFARGANWVPAEYFNGSNTHKNYKELLEMAKDANFNMIRIWGGGIYENNDFYNICDSLGIMVWQDFMFACAMYPADERFSKSVEDEVRYQVNRLFNHPSIVLWCGNNEVSNGWFDWGWQKQFNLSSEDSLKIWNDYVKIFRQLIPNTISQIDKTRKYIDSSPMYGWGHEEANTHGDSHYWGVWWGMLDFDMYYKKTGRFMSEYGFQGFPDISSFKKFIPEDSLYLYSQSLKTHQKHSTGFETINEYMKRDYAVPENFEDYIYVSQVLQAEGVQKAFDAHLSKMPHCMGTLFWQFNDCWPVVSWSAVDYYKNPKALYYYAKKSFMNTHISVIQENEDIDFHVVNHNNKNIDAKIIIKKINFRGNLLMTDSVLLNIPAISSVKINFNDSIKNYFKTSGHNTFGLIEVFDNKSQTLLNSRSFVTNKDNLLLLRKPNIRISTKELKEKWEVTIESDIFIKNIYLYAENAEGRFSDNYFNIIPNQPITIYFQTKRNIDELIIKYNSMNNININKIDKLTNTISDSVI